MRGASWVWIGLLAGLAGCQFMAVPVGAGADDAAGRLPWWDAAWAFRRPLAVAAGPKPPLGGYDGYTVRLAGVDTAALIAAGKLRAGCEDLRVLRWDGAAWTELPRHLLG